MKDFKYSSCQISDVMNGIQRATNDGYTDGFIVNGSQLEEAMYMIMDVRDFFEENYFPNLVKDFGNSSELLAFLSNLQYRLSEIEKDRLRSGKAISEAA